MAAPEIKWDFQPLAHQARAIVAWAAGREPKGEEHYKLCPMCGKPTWEITHTDRPTPLIVIDAATKLDKGCEMMSVLHPEITTWLAMCLDWRVPPSS